MRRAFLVAISVGVFAGQAMADGKHDHRIDEAAARIVAGKIGDIRGGFGPGQEPVIVDVSSEQPTGAIRRTSSVDWGGGSASAGWQGGLARAREPGRDEPLPN